MRPDVIVCWPNDCDYPLWREFILRERRRFGEVFVVFTEHHGGHDYRSFVAEALPDVTFLDLVYTADDWRDAAVNAALDESSAERVWFTEQDLMITDPIFWTLAGRGQMAGFRDDTPRWHPASLFVDRAVIDQTSRYFGPDPVDHFHAFGCELDGVVRNPTYLTGFRHMQGLAQNHYLTENGVTEGVFKRDEFHDYLAACLRSNVRLHPVWTDASVRELAS